MRRIQLDYQKLAERPRRLAGWLLLLTGAALLVEMGGSYDRMQREQAAIIHEVKTAKLNLEIPDKKTVEHQFSDRDFDAARLIIGRLSTPWNALFTGLESIGSENVAILTIRPDMQTGLLLIEGEAKDYAAVLTLIAQLRTIKPFSEVFLLHHEIKRDDPQHPVGFALSMHWIKAL